jgi:hypothetical protein
MLGQLPINFFRVPRHEPLTSFAFAVVFVLFGRYKFLSIENEKRFLHLDLKLINVKN